MKLELVNFRCYNHKIFDFKDTNLTLIEAVSGTGKSTIFSAIQWVLYGSRTIHTLPHVSDKKTTKAILTFNNTEIIRTARPNTLNITHNSKKYEGEDAQSIIYSIFGGDEDVWLVSSYMKQAEKNLIMTVNQSERLKILNNIAYNRDEPSLYKTKTKDSIKSLKSKHEQLNKQLLSDSSKYSMLTKNLDKFILENIDTIDIQSHIFDLQREYKKNTELLSELDAKYKKYNQIEDNYRKQKTKFDIQNTRLHELEKILSELQNNLSVYETDIDTYSQSIQDYTNKLQSLDKEYSTHKSIISSYRKQEKLLYKQSTLQNDIDTLKQYLLNTEYTQLPVELQQDYIENKDYVKSILQYKKHLEYKQLYKEFIDNYNRLYNTSFDYSVDSYYSILDKYNDDMVVYNKQLSDYNEQLSLYNQKLSEYNTYLQEEQNKSKIIEIYKRYKDNISEKCKTYVNTIQKEDILKEYREKDIQPQDLHSKQTITNEQTILNTIITQLDNCITEDKVKYKSINIEDVKLQLHNIKSKSIVKHHQCPSCSTKLYIEYKKPDNFVITLQPDIEKQAKTLNQMLDEAKAIKEGIEEYTQTANTFKSYKSLLDGVYGSLLEFEKFCVENKLDIVCLQNIDTNSDNKDTQDNTHKDTLPSPPEHPVKPSQPEFNIKHLTQTLDLYIHSTVDNSDVKAIEDYYDNLYKQHLLNKQITSKNEQLSGLQEQLTILNKELQNSIKEDVYKSSIEFTETTYSRCKIDYTNKISYYTTQINEHKQLTKKIEHTLHDIKHINSTIQEINIDSITFELSSCKTELLDILSSISMELLDTDIQDNIHTIYTTTTQTISTRNNTIEKLLKDYSSIEDVRKFKKEIETHKQNITEIEDEHQSLTRILKVIEAIENSSLSEVVDMLNSIVEDLCKKVFEDELTIKFRLYKENKTGNTKSEIGIDICYKNTEMNSINSLSGGETQRVMVICLIAFNILTNNPLILLDEATTSLDNENREKIIELIQDVCIKKYKKTVLFISHEEVEGRFDEVLHLC